VLGECGGDAFGDPGSGSVPACRGDKDVQVSPFLFSLATPGVVRRRPNVMAANVLYRR